MPQGPPRQRRTRLSDPIPVRFPPDLVDEIRSRETEDNRSVSSISTYPGSLVSRLEFGPDRVLQGTIYNLLGTREDLLLTLVDRVIEGLISSLAKRMQDTDRDPIGDARMIIEVSTAALASDSSAYRQIIGSLGDFGLSRSMMAIDPAQL